MIDLRPKAPMLLRTILAIEAIHKESELTVRILQFAKRLAKCTVADWDSMGRVVTQTRGRAFQTLDRVFQTLGGAFDFLLRLQKFGGVFGKLSQVFERLG